MSLKQKIIAVVAGFIAALLPLLVVEHYDVSRIVAKTFFGQSHEITSFSRYAVQSSYYDKVKSVMLIIGIFFLVYMFIYALILEGLALIYFIISSKYSKPKIFISYKNTADDATVDTGKIAGELKKHLEKSGFEVLQFPYSPTMHHDEVNFKIRAMIKQCHAMVVVPDPYNPSYVDTEIQTAVSIEKPVFLIRHTKDQRLPNTANSGHTVFIWSKLKKNKFDALNYLLLYTYNHWTTRSFIIEQSLGAIIMPFAELSDDNDIYLKFLGTFALATLGLIYFDVPVNSVFYFVRAIVIALGFFAGYSVVAGVFKRNREHQIASQATPGDLSAYQIFQQAGIDKKYLASMDPKGLAIGH